MFRYTLVVFLLSSVKIDASSLLKQGKSHVLDKFLTHAGGVKESSEETILGKKVNNVQEQVGADWPLGFVSYYFDIKSYDYMIARRVRNIMNSLESTSCFKFKPLILKPTDNSTWIHFTNPDNQRECSHKPKILDNGEIVMVLGLDCLLSKDIIHTLLHCIGFKDEITHPHRDQYVRVLWENIQPENRHLFHIRNDENPTKTLVEYDPTSVMHFHDRAFSRNGHATIAPLIPGLSIKPSNELSQLDKMKMRLLFGHECNKRNVGDLLDSCKIALHGDIQPEDDNKKNNVDKFDISGDDKIETENERQLTEPYDNKKDDDKSASVHEQIETENNPELSDDIKAQFGVDENVQDMKNNQDNLNNNNNAEVALTENEK